MKLTDADKHHEPLSMSDALPKRDEITDPVMELAELEHGRWNVERLAYGWTYAPEKDVNRINGDSHWHEIENPHNPSIITMVSEVERVFVELRNCGLEMAHNVVVACSPEFCPAEYWQLLLSAIKDNLMIDEP